MSERVFQAMKRSLRLLVNRCVLLLVDDGRKVQEAQVRLLADETRDRVERFQEYGFTSVPHPEAEGVAVFMGSDRGHGVIIATEDRRYRIKGLASGEVAIYTDEDQGADGCRIVLRRGNRVEIQAADIDMRAENRLHLSGRHVEIHADERREMDVAGYGDALNYRGGTLWQSDSYTRGATFLPSMEHGIQPPEIGGFHELMASLLAQPGTTDMEQLLLCIPAIADAESADATDPDATGWALLSGFLRKWFCTGASTDKAAQSPAYVEWDWLLQYVRVQLAWSNLAATANLFSTAAQEALADLLPESPTEAVAFDFIDVPVGDLHAGHFNYQTVNTLSLVDGLTAAMGAFTIFAVAKGTVEPVTDGRKITVTEVAFFVRDNFDFEGSYLPFMPDLGYWDCGDLEFSIIGGTGVDNADFAGFRTSHGQGGDFYVMSSTRQVEDFTEFWYEI